MTEKIGLAYDFIAADYDRLLQRDYAMRALLWRRYARLFREGDQVLDFCCGTGLDALFLAQRGVHVTGLDASTGMIDQLQKKTGLVAGKLTARVGTTDDLEKIPPQTYHGIVSAFAGLNTVTDLPQFAALAHRLLRPKGWLMVHMLAPPGLWERIRFAQKRQWRKVWDTSAEREKTIVVCGQPIRHVRLPPHDTYLRFFRSYFDLRRLYSLGFLWPYAWEGRLPRLMSRLGARVESFVGMARPFSQWGRFFVLEMQKKDWSAGAPTSKTTLNSEH
jgi:ubiquinone/menaquinone biosynthesis C-methylase UbiE